MAEKKPGSRRAQQKLRTRKDLLEAAAGLMRDGHRPASLEEVAEAAMVSRATAYRYFPSIEALLLEVQLDLALPTPDMLLAGASDDPLERLERVDSAFETLIENNDRALRMMLIQSLERSLSDEADQLPRRQNRRSALVEAALGDLPGVAPERRERLVNALGLLFGAEAMVVFADVLRLDPAAARETRRWMIRALLKDARG